MQHSTEIGWYVLDGIKNSQLLYSFCDGKIQIWEGTTPITCEHVYLFMAFGGLQDVANKEHCLKAYSSVLGWAKKVIKEFLTDNEDVEEQSAFEHALTSICALMSAEATLQDLKR